MITQSIQQARGWLPWSLFAPFAVAESIHRPGPFLICVWSPCLSSLRSLLVSGAHLRSECQGFSGLSSAASCPHSGPRRANEYERTVCCSGTTCFGSVDRPQGWTLGEAPGFILSGVHQDTMMGDPLPWSFVSLNVDWYQIGAHSASGEVRWCPSLTVRVNR